MAKPASAIAFAFLLLTLAVPDSASPQQDPLSRHVIVVSVDGLRPDAIDAAGARTLRRLLEDGSATLEAQTILPSVTLPSHTSMLTGVGPETHGVTWNSDRTEELGTVDVPTLFDLVHRAGYRTAAVFSKEKFRHLVHDGTLDVARVPRGGVLPASRSVAEAVRYIRTQRPNLLFVHIADPDFMGHSTGWMSRMYRFAVREADAGVQDLMDAATQTFGAGNFTLIVTADHGGHGRSHGSSDPLDTTIPWISWGKGIRAEHTIEGPVRTMDTAATVLHVMGVPVPTGWEGVPVAEALLPNEPALAVSEPLLGQEAGTP